MDVHVMRNMDVPTHPPHPCGAARISQGTDTDKGITKYSRNKRPRPRCCSARNSRSTKCRCSLRTGSLRYCRTNKRSRPRAPDPPPAATRGAMARAASGTGEGNEALGSAQTVSAVVRLCRRRRPSSVGHCSRFDDRERAGGEAVAAQRRYPGGAGGDANPGDASGGADVGGPSGGVCPGGAPRKVRFSLHRWAQRAGCLWSDQQAPQTWFAQMRASPPHTLARKPERESVRF